MKPGWNSFSSLAIGAVAFTILGVGAAGAPPIAGFHLVSIEDCGNPLQEAHLVVEGKGGQYAASLFPDATLQERTYSDGNLVIYKYPGLPSTARYKVRAVYLSDTANRRVKVLAGGMPVDGPFAEPQGKVGVREFEIPAGDAGRRIWVEFDGAMRDMLVWVNGCFVGRNDNGYAPFRFDITDFLAPCRRNNPSCQKRHGLPDHTPVHCQAQEYKSVSTSASTTVGYRTHMGTTPGHHQGATGATPLMRE